MLVAIFTILLASTPALAHQPKIIAGEKIEVIDPAVSKAYYGTLSGTSHIYTINASEPFDLYVGILMPYFADSKRDITAEIRSGDEVLKTLGGKDTDWETMFEFFGQSRYWDGGEYKKRVEAGKYTITVFSPDNDNKYSLAVGEIEAFTISETINSLQVIPELKRDFFDESPISFIKSPFGWGYILVMYILSFVFGFFYRFILKAFNKGSVRYESNNIGRYDRSIRLVLWLGLLIWAVTTTWSPWLLFFSGYVLFTVIFSWCGFYAVIGKNTSSN